MAESRMTELESLLAERHSISNKADSLQGSADTLRAMVAKINARIAELEREPQRWRPEDRGEHWYVHSGGKSWSRSTAPLDPHDTNAFPTEARAKEVATHFKRLGRAAQWGALLTDEAYDSAAEVVAHGKTWRFWFPTAAHRDGFMRDAEKDGLL